MAFNWPTFRTRTLTAIIFAAVMLAGLLWNQWSFFVLFSIIHFGCWWEYLKLTEKIHNTEIDKVIKYFLCITGFIILLAVGYRGYSADFTITLNSYTIRFKWLFAIVALISLFAFLFQNRQIPNKAKWLAVAGLVYISLSIGMLIDLSQMGINWCGHSNLATTRLPLVIIVSIWVNDTMAYIVGSLIGKTPLTKISPKKTWEGTIGGILLAVVVTALLLPVIYTGNINWPLPLFFAVVAFIAAVAGTFGDLLESKLKRMAGVKDSGSIMPGHGGFLDRFDSLLLATPAVWIYVKLFMR